MWTIAKRILTAGMVGVTLRDMAINWAFVRGRSMQPTLSPGDDRAKFQIFTRDLILISKLYSHSFNYERGEIVVFRSPFEPKEHHVKRLIGLPGDTISLPGGTVQVPPGHCWVEGDNPVLSSDSLKTGPIPLGLLEGRVTRVLWPPSRFRKMEACIPSGKIISQSTFA